MPSGNRAKIISQVNKATVGFVYRNTTMMADIQALRGQLPGLDCGACGAPTCRAFAEDVVQGVATKMDCIHMMKDQLRVMAQQMVDLAKTSRD